MPAFTQPEPQPRPPSRPQRPWWRGGEGIIGGRGRKTTATRIFELSRIARTLGIGTGNDVERARAVVRVWRQDPRAIAQRRQEIQRARVLERRAGPAPLPSPPRDPNLPTPIPPQTPPTTTSARVGRILARATDLALMWSQILAQLRGFPTQKPPVTVIRVGGSVDVPAPPVFVQPGPTSGGELMPGFGGFSFQADPTGYGGAMGGSASTWLDVLRSGVQALPAIFGAGGGPLYQSSPGILGPSVEEPGAGGLLGDVNLCPTMFRAGNAANIRPLPLLSAVNPATGMLTYWRHVGRPILFTGDAALSRRIEKTCRRAMRGRGRRSFR